MNILTPREEKVLELRNQGLTLEQVGKELGITRERVRQIELKANRRLEYAKKREINEVRNDCIKAIKWLRENKNEWEGAKDYMVDTCLDTIEKEVRKLDVVISVLNGEYDFDIEQEIHPILDKPIQDLDLSNRAYNCLMRYFTFGCVNYGKQTIAEPKVKDLCNLTEEDLMRVRNFGFKCLKEIKDKLESLGLYLKEEEYDD